MNEVEPKKPSSAKRVTIGIVIGIVIIVSLIFAYNSLNRPKPEIVRVNGYMSGWGYTVEVTVKNNGGEGNVRVYVEIYNRAGRHQQRNHLMYLRAGKVSTEEFYFDVSLWEAITIAPITYRVWVEVRT